MHSSLIWYVDKQSVKLFNKQSVKLFNSIQFRKWFTPCKHTLHDSFSCTDFDNGSLRLPDLDYWLTAGVTGQQGMLTPPSTCSQLWHIQGSVFAMHSCLYCFFFNYEIYYYLLSLSIHFNVKEIRNYTSYHSFSSKGKKTNPHY